jgi:hypothetical protein
VRCRSGSEESRSSDLKSTGGYPSVFRLAKPPNHCTHTPITQRPLAGEEDSLPDSSIGPDLASVLAFTMLEPIDDVVRVHRAAANRLSSLNGRFGKAPTVRDGLYRMEFSAGGRRGVPVVVFDLAAEVFDGAGKGPQVGETFSFSFGRVTGAGNEQKIRAYAHCLGVTGNQLDLKEWLFRPFVAEVVDQRIVAISDGEEPFVHLPVSAEAPRKMVWSAEEGWRHVDLPSSQLVYGSRFFA